MLRLFCFTSMASRVMRGWLYDTGPALAKQNVAVYILDRRGSGVSQGVPGDVVSVEVLLSDYCNALSVVRNEFPKVPLTLLGQSFGGSILAALISWQHFNINYDAAVFCASALGIYKENTEGKSTVDEWHQLYIPDEAYTSNDSYLKFIKADKYCIRSITERTNRAFSELVQSYMPAIGSISAKPSLFLYPKTDPLVEYTTPLKIFNQLCDNSGIVVEFPISHHYLEFSPLRKQYYQLLANYALTAGYHCYA